MKSNRRNFIRTMGTSAAGITIGATAINSVSCSSQTPVETENDRQILFIGDNIALADTQYGKVKGYVLRVLDDVSEVKNDPDREARKALPST